AKKLDISAYEYIFDRVSKRYKYPSLADIIRSRSVVNRRINYEPG
ncbi:unnamed protein product, partial [marine sediment metagenome]